MKTVYIAHPLMGSTPEAKALGWGDIEKNVERYLVFCAWASNNGYTVITWVHHYLMHVRGLTKGDADFYLSRDKIILKPADVLWQCGPPEASSGLLFELYCAEEFDIHVEHESEWDDPNWMPDPFSPLPDHLMPEVK